MWEATQIVTVSGFLIHLLVASALGYAIGFERQWTKHQAGTVTVTMVVVGSYAFTAFAFLLAQSGNADFTRIPGQIVTGIGFLGAGVILKDGGTIKGLTTAATVWASAAVGILVCFDNMWFAVLVTAALVLLHLCLHPFSIWIDKNRRYKKTRYDKEEKLYKITVVCPKDTAPFLKENIMTVVKNEPDVLLHNLETSDEDEDNKKIRVFLTTKNNDNAKVESLLTRFGKAEDIVRAGWKIVQTDED